MGKEWNNMDNLNRQDICKGSVYTPDVKNDNPERIIPTVPIKEYSNFIRPSEDKAARLLGDKCVQEILENHIADFEKNEIYCQRNEGSKVDLMVHVSTFIILDGYIYMTYYANTGTEKEDPTEQEARLAYCPVNDPADMTILRLQKVGEELDGRVITHVYDTILMYKGGDELYLMWTASPENNYHRLYRTFSLSKKTLGPILTNRFKVGEVVNDFSISGMKAALAWYEIPHKAMWSDIGIMQKLSTRVENGKTWYYSGAYSGNFNCIIKSLDLITWEYVSAPEFINNSLWENATYVLGEKVYYFVRQQECTQGFLTVYNLDEDTWEPPVLIEDCQSRSDFIYYEGGLYLIHAPMNREGIGMIKVDQENIANSKTVFVADMKHSCFYPYVSVYGSDVYISYTDNRKHITLSKFDIRNYVSRIV